MRVSGAEEQMKLERERERERETDNVEKENKDDTDEGSLSRDPLESRARGRLNETSKHLCALYFLSL